MYQFDKMFEMWPACDNSMAKALDGQRRSPSRNLVIFNTNCDGERWLKVPLSRHECLQGAWCGGAASVHQIEFRVSRSGQSRDACAATGSVNTTALVATCSESGYQYSITRSCTLSLTAPPHDGTSLLSIFRCTAAGPDKSPCRCPGFDYIFAQGAFILRCRCKHRHTDHHPLSKACTLPGCPCAAFDSPFVCNCDHGWAAHRQEAIASGGGAAAVLGDDVNRWDLLQRGNDS